MQKSKLDYTNRKRPSHASPPRHQDRRHPGPRLQRPAAAGADDCRGRERGAPELQPWQGQRPCGSRHHGARGCPARRARGGHHGRPAGPEDPRRQVCRWQGDAGAGRALRARRLAHRARRPAGRGPGLQGAAARRQARRHAAAQRRPDRAHGGCRARRCGAYHRQAGRRAVQQQGHQQAGRRSDGAGADGQGHGGHQDGDELPGRLCGGELSEERHRHGDGAPAVQRGRGRVPPQAGPDRKNRARRGHSAPGGNPQGERRHHGRAR